MDSFTKIKILIFVGLGILILLVMYLFISAGNKDKENIQSQTSNVAMRSQQTSKFTIDDMMKTTTQGNNANYNTTGMQSYNRLGGTVVEPTNNSQTQQNDAEITALQEQLRENLDNQKEALKKITQVKEDQPGITTNNSNSVPAAAIVPEPVIIQQQVVEEQPQKKQRRFYDGKEQQQSLGNSTRAVVHGEQTVMSGGTLKMRLLESLQTNDNMTIPANTFVYGTVSFAEERVQVKIISVRMGNNIHELKRDVYDRDGIKGVYVPDNIKSDIRKTATGEAINDADVEEVVTTSSGGNIFTKAIGTVGNAVKSVVGRNTQQQKVTIKTNYEIYLQ
jgi:conjugative transposon TraM protein